eukprot:NODE_159_length_15043_cov_0.440444.p12 type:complete len:107 gc:universal NODE_159_length_15043_cov_0.440444:13190-12870(-)
MHARNTTPIGTYLKADSTNRYRFGILKNVTKTCEIISVSKPLNNESQVISSTPSFDQNGLIQQIIHLNDFGLWPIMDCTVFIAHLVRNMSKEKKQSGLFCSSSICK